jgi:hypothetical protein
MRCRTAPILAPRRRVDARRKPINGKLDAMFRAATIGKLAPPRDKAPRSCRAGNPALHSDRESYMPPRVNDLAGYQPASMKQETECRAASREPQGAHRRFRFGFSLSSGESTRAVTPGSMALPLFRACRPPCQTSAESLSRAFRGRRRSSPAIAPSPGRRRLMILPKPIGRSGRAAPHELRTTAPSPGYSA